MEHLVMNNAAVQEVHPDDVIEVETDRTFISANTVPALLEEVQQHAYHPRFCPG